MRRHSLVSLASTLVLMTSIFIYPQFAAYADVIPSVVQLASGGFQNCALMTNGVIDCWSVDNGGTPTFVPQPSIPGVSQIGTGGDHVCAVVKNGSVMCWGDSTFGQLGNGAPITAPSDTTNSTPQVALGISSATSISVALRNTCAVLADGSAMCWGENQSGVLGNGNTLSTSTPTKVVGLSGIEQISISHVEACALVAGGSVYCWGALMGTAGTWDSVTSPVIESGVTGATQIAVSDSESCALLTGGSVVCWGYNYTTTSPPATPTIITGLSGVTQISATDNHMCALTSAGSIGCWGDVINQYGSQYHATPLFIGEPTNTSAPITNATSIVATLPGVACATLTDKSVSCWSSADGNVYILGPTAPMLVNATAGDQQVTVSWIDSSNTGLPVLGHSVIQLHGNTKTQVCEVVGVNYCVVKNLVNGDLYAFQVMANNGLTNGYISNLSPTVSPAPSAVTTTTVTTTTTVLKGSRPLVVAFSAGHSALNPVVKRQITNWAQHLTHRAMITVTGYAKLNAHLARSRATNVAVFLSSRIAVRVVIRVVTKTSWNRATLAIS